MSRVRRSRRGAVLAVCALGGARSSGVSEPRSGGRLFQRIQRAGAALVEMAPSRPTVICSSAPAMRSAHPVRFGASPDLSPKLG